MPAMNRPMPTVMVPSGNAILDADGVGLSERGAVLKQTKVTWCWKCPLLLLAELFCYDEH